MVESSGHGSKRGDNIDFDFVYTINDEVVDLTDLQLRCQMRKGDDIQLMSITVLDAVAGSMKLTAPPSQSRQMIPGTWLFDVQTTSQSGFVASTPTYSYIIEQDVTDSEEV